LRHLFNSDQLAGETGRSAKVAAINIAQQSEGQGLIVDEEQLSTVESLPNARTGPVAA